MTRAEASKLWPIIKAFGEGKTIQLNYNTLENPDWQDTNLPNFNFFPNFFPNSYRIKPEPKLRPWKPEEVPVGCLLLFKHTPPTVLLSCDDGCVTYAVSKRLEKYTLLDLFRLDVKYSTNGGKTWYPCGVEE